MRAWIGIIWLRIGSNEILSYKHGTERSGFMRRGGEFLTNFRTLGIRMSRNLFQSFEKSHELFLPGLCHITVVIIFT